MHTFLIITHVATMIASMLLMSGAIGLGIFGRESAIKVASAAMGATVVGFATGLFLMIDSPLTVKCALLTSYLVAVTAAYWYGYGLGRIEYARFVRSTAKN